MTTLQQVTAADQALVRLNENFESVSPAGLYARNPATTVGLTLGYYGGYFGGALVPDGTITLDASESAVYVVAERATGTVSQSTTSTDWADTETYFRIGIAQTSATTITTWADHREAYAAPVSGGGGGGGAVSSVNGQTGAVVLSTDDIEEGSENFYLTVDRLSDLLVAGSNISIDADSTGTLTISATGGGGGGGGDTDYITTSIDTTAPNDTTNAIAWEATGGSTNADLVISPKGTGAIQAHVADGTTAGGEKRGSNAFDMQSGARSAATQVASGQESVTLGARCTASGSTAVALGEQNDASGPYTFSTGSYNKSSGYGAANLGGSLSDASGIRSVTLGGLYLGSRGISGLVSFGSVAGFVGQKQGDLLVLGASTFNATPTRLYSDTTGPTAASQLTLVDDSAASITGTVTAFEPSTGDVKAWRVEALAHRGSGAATTVIVGSDATEIGATTGAASWSIAITADTTYGCLAIDVTGGSSSTIQWCASIMAAFTAS